MLQAQIGVTLMEKSHTNNGGKMHIKVFTYSKNEKETKKIINELLKNELQYIKEIEYKQFEPYWKFDDMFKTKLEVQFNEAFTQDKFTKFLESISDKWIDEGDSVLASDTTEGCNYIKEGVGLIEIFFN